LLIFFNDNYSLPLERVWRYNFANIEQTVKPTDLPTLPSRLFRRMKFTQTDSGEEHHSNNIDDFFGSIWSLRSKVSNKSPDTVRTKYYRYYNLNFNQISFKTVVNNDLIFKFNT
jgi:hypothetical protein